MSHAQFNYEPLFFIMLGLNLKGFNWISLVFTMTITKAEESIVLFWRELKESFISIETVQFFKNSMI